MIDVFACEASVFWQRQQKNPVHGVACGVSSILISSNGTLVVCFPLFPEASVSRCSKLLEK